VQTGLTGADVYYWFIEGFGDIDYLKDSHYAPIDLPIMDAVISFIVQEYFCYRIWALTRNKRSSWLWVVIAFVRVQVSPFPPNVLTRYFASRSQPFKRPGQPGEELR